ncbi:MAG: cyclase family protein [Verrucomicrobiota bacterium]
MTSLVDLTLTLTPEMPGVGFEEKCSVEKDGWNATTVELYSHVGTHMDAPVHFGVSETSIDQIPLEQCRGPAHVVDLKGLDRKALIEVVHLGDVVDHWCPGDSLLLDTGWSRHAGDPVLYRSSFPRVSEGLARWCVDRKVRILGVEAPSVADVENLEEVTRIHRILLGGDVVIVEGLAGLAQLKSTRVLFSAFPLKLGGVDGSPCRAFAEDSDPVKR